MIWERCLKILHQEMSEHSYVLWIKPIIAKQYEYTLLLYTPNAYFVQYITDNFLNHIRDIIFEISDGGVSEVQVKFDPKEIKLDRRDTVNFQPEQIRRTLNKGYLFEEFVEGTTNKVALDTCKKVVEQFGNYKFSPLFLYGASGLGKTHLLQAIGHSILEKSKKIHMMYLTSEQFVEWFISAIRHQQLEQFRSEFRSLDLLLVDDIQFLIEKSVSLDEFFYVFNDLLSESKQIILTSRLYPQEIIALDSRWFSYLSKMLSIEIEPPELESRVGILLRYSKLNHLTLSNECAFRIAQQVYGGVRDLQDALDQVNVASKLEDIEINMGIIEETLKDRFTLRTK